MININDHVLAAVNSATRYGIGLILLFLQKKQINGVNVKITMSFDVKMVKIAVKAYSIMKSRYWFLFAFLAAKIAKYLNNPTSSRKIERIVIEKNKTMILSGLTVVLLTNSFPTSLIGANENAKRIIAPIRAMIQYVPNLIFPILKVGKNRIEQVISRNVTQEIIIVGIIKTHKTYYAPFCKKVI